MPALKVNCVYMRAQRRSRSAIDPQLIKKKRAGKWLINKQRADQAKLSRAHQTWCKKSIFLYVDQNMITFFNFYLIIMNPIYVSLHCSFPFPCRNWDNILFIFFWNTWEKKSLFFKLSLRRPIRYVHKI